jgi:TDG/mug DNA glycosylase family protein
MRPLPDLVPERPRILFVGINPSLRSAAVGHHFAGPGNPFWRLLHAAALVPEHLTYADDRRLPALGLGLTNIVVRPTREAAELSAEEIARGRRRLERRIARARPGLVAFVGATVYRWFFGQVASPGCGPKPERIAGAPVFVVPNPSGRNAAYPGFADKLVWYRRLRRYAEAEGGPSRERGAPRCRMRGGDQRAPRARRPRSQPPPREGAR